MLEYPVSLPRLIIFNNLTVGLANASMCCLKVSLLKSGRSKLSSNKQEGRLDLLVDNGAGGRQTNFQCIPVT
jgi:hypothetical protein